MSNKNKKALKIIAGTLAGLGAVGGGAAGIALALNKDKKDEQKLNDVKPLNPNRNNPNVKPGIFTEGYKLEDKYGLDSAIAEFINIDSENKSNKKEAETFLFNIIEKMIGVDLSKINESSDSIKGKILDFAVEMSSSKNESRFFAETLDGSLYLEKIFNGKRNTLIINPSAEGNQKVTYEFEDASTSLFAFSVIRLDLKSQSDVIKQGIPYFIKSLGNKLLSVLFKSRIDAVSKILSASGDKELTSAEVQDAIAKETFNNIYSAPVHITVDKGEFDIKLGDILLVLSQKDHENPSLLDSILRDGDLDVADGLSLFSKVQDLLKDADYDLGGEASFTILSQLSTIVATGDSDALQPVIDSLSGVLPSDISFGLQNNDLTIKGLLTNVSSLIIKDVYKINDAAGISREDLEKNPEYRRIVAAAYAYKLSVGLIREGESGLASQNVSREDLNVAFNAANGGSVSYEQFQSFKNDQLDGKPGKRFNEFINIVTGAQKGTDVSKELIGYATSAIIDLGQLAIPELQFGRGAGQLGENERQLATNLSASLSKYSRKIVEMILGANGFDSETNHSEWVKAENNIISVQILISIVSMYCTPVVDGHYQMSGMTKEENDKFVLDLGFKTLVGYMTDITNNVSSANSGGFDDFGSSGFDDFGPAAPKTPEQIKEEAFKMYTDYVKGELGSNTLERISEFLLYNDFQKQYSVGSTVIGTLLFNLAGAFM